MSVAAAVRLAVVALSLAGIVAMHGLSMTDAAGAHRSPLVLGPAASVAHSVPATHGAPVIDMGPSSDTAAVPVERLELQGPVTQVGSAAVVPDPWTPVLDPAAGHTGHAAMAGCLAILLGLIGIAALRLGYVSRSIGGPRTSTRSAFTPTAARAPPQPIFLSLCVFRT